MVTALPPNSGGYITASFTPNATAKGNIIKSFTLSTQMRKVTLGKHFQYVGAYGATKKPGKGIRVTPILLPTLGIDDSGGPEKEVFVATLSNVANEGQAVIVPLDQMTGSTIRLVTSDFAKTMPKKILRGQPFKSTVRKVAAIKDLLPEDAATIQYCLIICSNALLIPSGEPYTVKGTADDAMADYFRDLGDPAFTWLQVQTDLTKGVVPFSLELQELVEINKLAFDQFYPKHTVRLDLTPQPFFTFTSPQADLDEDDPIESTMAELRAQLAECVKRNMPEPAATPAALPSSIDPDLASMMIMDPKTAASATTTNDRYEAKLRLICASFSEADGVSLFDLKDGVKGILALGKTSQAEALSNLLTASSETLADTMDAINRKADWPASYAVTT